MILAAISLVDNDDFSVKTGQVLFAFENDTFYINPETQEFDQSMFDNYLEKGSGTDYPERALAEIFDIEWKELDYFPEVLPPIPPVNE